MKRSKLSWTPKMRQVASVMGLFTSSGFFFAAAQRAGRLKIAFQAAAPPSVAVLCSERKAVLRSLIASPVAREFFPLEAVSSPWPVDRRAKDPSLALGQACPGSEQEGPVRGRAVPSQATERRAREVACLPTGASLGGTQPRFLNKLRPAGVMVLSAVCPMRASRNLASGRRAPLCPVRDQRGERIATKNAGLPCLVPAGRAAA